MNALQFAFSLCVRLECRVGKLVGIGEDAGIRTRDAAISRHPLYHLSYILVSFPILTIRSSRLATWKPARASGALASRTIAGKRAVVKFMTAGEQSV